MTRPIATCNTKEAYQLFHEGSLALSKAERKGILIDQEYTKAQIKNFDDKIDTIKNRIWSSKVGQHWKTKYGLKASLASNPQTIYILYKYLKLYPTNMQKGLEYKVDNEWLSKIDHPLVKDILSMRSLEKAVNTYLRPIMREVNEDGRMRFFFHLNMVASYRSGSGKSGEDSDDDSAGNFQNQPSRDPVMTKIVKSCYLPDPDFYFGELDFSSLEVRVACASHKDPTMIKYLLDGYDMHSAMAKLLFCLSDEEWSSLPGKNAKKIRQTAKGMFVFAEQYGDFYAKIAPNLWAGLESENLMYSEDKTLKAHLFDYFHDSAFEMKMIAKYEDAKGKTRERQNKEVQDFLGIRLAGVDIMDLDEEEWYQICFLNHVKEVERHFWDDVFHVYRDWKVEEYNRYLTNGYIDSFTGFRYSNKMSRNQVINYPTQGSAFHVLLWCYIQIQKEIEKRGLKSYLVGEIHDSVVAVIHKDEKDMFVDMCQDIMERQTMERFKWLNVPMIAEAELAPIGLPWYYKMDKKDLDEFEKVLMCDKVAGVEIMKNKFKYNKETAMKVLNNYRGTK